MILRGRMSRIGPPPGPDKRCEGGGADGIELLPAGDDPTEHRIGEYRDEVEEREYLVHAIV